MLISLSAGCGIPSSLSFLLVAELSLSAECGLLFRAPSLFSLRCIVFLLSAAVFADPALYLAVGRLCLGLVELSCPLTQSRASSTSGTVSSAAYLCCVELLTLSYHILSTLNLATALLSALGRASKIGTSLRVIVWIICASHGTCGVAAVFCAILISS